MINISEINRAKELNSSSKTRKNTGSGNFSALLQETMQADSSSSVSVSAGINGADALLAAQMIVSDDEQERRRQLFKHGENLLDRLEEIRLGLLAGSLSKDRLIEIARMVRERRFNADDPRLQEIISEIELRVEVELAKLTK